MKRGNLNVVRAAVGSLLIVMMGCETMRKADSSDSIPLDAVVKEVTQALDEYQNNLGGGGDALPPIASADLGFKVVVSQSVGVGASWVILKLGAGRASDVTNDVTFSYTPPKSIEVMGLQPPPTLKSELARTIQSAAKALKSGASIGNLEFSKLTLSVQFGVKETISGGVGVPINLVTVGLNAERNHSSIQSVKLVFGK